MGFAPAQVAAMSLWEFMACSDGYQIAHGAKEGAAGGDLSADQLADMGIEGF